MIALVKSKSMKSLGTVSKYVVRPSPETICNYYSKSGCTAHNRLVNHESPMAAYLEK